MISKPKYCANLEIAERFFDVPGAVVECGTWRGGMIGGISSLLGQDKGFYLFDSFEGLPPATEKDGEKAKDYQNDADADNFYDNCTASEEDAKKAMKMAGFNASINKGWFNKTLPNYKIDGGISILRMDADWYDSTMDILNNLFDQVNPGGVIIIDDYYYWEGCSKAVHDFLSQNSRTETINQHKDVCFIKKEK